MRLTLSESPPSRAPLSIDSLRSLISESASSAGSCSENYERTLRNSQRGDSGRRSIKMNCNRAGIPATPSIHLHVPGTYNSIRLHQGKPRRCREGPSLMPFQIQTRRMHDR